LLLLLLLLVVVEVAMGLVWPTTAAAATASD
jgi:hypothetical protein